MFSLIGTSQTVKYAAFLIILGLPFWRIFRRYGLSCALLWAWLGFEACRIFLAPQSPFASEQPAFVEAFSSSSAATIFIIYSFIISARNINIKILNIIAYVNAALIFFNGSGLLFNASMSGCLNAMLLPFANPWIIGASILYAGQSQPLALLFVAVLLRLSFTFAYPLAMFGGIAGYYLTGFDTNGRLEVWKIVMDFWQQHASPWLGFGLGSFYVAGPVLTSWRHERFMTLHSDWLQILFELGIPGIILALLVYFKALYKARKRVALRSSLILAGLFMIANFPLHNPISGFCIVLLMLQAL